MTTWRVREGTQAKYNGTLHQPGDTFSASEGQVRAAGVSFYVEEVKERAKPGPKPKDAEAKAQQSSANKAQQPEQNKAESSPDKGR